MINLSVIELILLTGAVWASAETPFHGFHYIYGCYESGEVRVDVLMDEDVAAYADFSKEEVVFSVPHQPQAVMDLKKRAYEFAKSSKAHCQSVLGKARKASDPGAPIRQDAPEISVYSRYEGNNGVVNTLFCLANHFYPPSINFTWTKNGVVVTKGVLDLRYRQNSDGTFHRISMLSFTPRDGDIYSCSVQHRASHQPLARSWGETRSQELKGSRSSLSPATGFLCASLIFCLIGISAGVFFFTKQPN